MECPPPPRVPNLQRLGSGYSAFRRGVSAAESAEEDTLAIHYGITAALEHTDHYGITTALEHSDLH